ncbi:hypothetical protein PTTG_26284 [Puccinia triticina 1-1 BBBD Race 1]|uniref:Uncharacterized protein n=1 Tax=Puccinia triticina (isolate 1-1 / race 1 (BBBD)) TaxID=630390 RepID=A0A180GWH2_PUCT1|nr:hypothetical protein PTTG_26284 [Puccinia triticina 1-1 BBBD Race 1]
MNTQSHERSISPSEYNKWFHHPLTSPLERHVPTLFDGTRHLVELQDRRREGFVRSQCRQLVLDPSIFGPALPAADQEQRRQLVMDPSIFGVELPATNQASDWTQSQPACTQSHQSQPTNSQQSLAASHSTSDSHEVPIDVGKLVVNWDSHNYNINRFKEAAISTIQNDKEESAGLFAQAKENEGKLTWNLIIPHGGPFVAVQKRQINCQETFKRFLLAAEGASETHPIVFCLVQQDPTSLAQEELAYKHLRTTMDTGSSSVENPLANGPSQGFQNAASLAELISQLESIHKAAPHLTGSHEGHVFINPANSNKYFNLTVGWASAWAKAIQNNPGEVTQLVPPQLDQIQFRTVGDLPPPLVSAPAPAAPAPVLNPFNCPGMFYNPMNMGTPTNTMNMVSPMNMPSSLNMSAPSVQSQGSSSLNAPRTPTPPNNTSTITEFLQFAHVDLNSPKVQGRMNTLGITNWTMFKWFDAQELQNKGIPKGPARSI